MCIWYTVKWITHTVASIWGPKDFSGRLKSCSCPLWSPHSCWGAYGILRLLNLLLICHHKQILHCSVMQKKSNFWTENCKHGDLLLSLRPKTGGGEVPVRGVKLLLYRKRSWGTGRICDSLEVREEATGNQKQNLPLLPQLWALANRQMPPCRLHCIRHSQQTQSPVKAKIPS